jgi:hypothetical protein
MSFHWPQYCGAVGATARTVLCTMRRHGCGGTRSPFCNLSRRDVEFDVVRARMQIRVALSENSVQPGHLEVRRRVGKQTDQDIGRLFHHYKRPPPWCPRSISQPLLVLTRSLRPNLARLTTTFPFCSLPYNIWPLKDFQSVRTRQILRDAQADSSGCPREILPRRASGGTGRPSVFMFLGSVPYISLQYLSE